MRALLGALSCAFFGCGSDVHNRPQCLPGDSDVANRPLLALKWKFGFSGGGPACRRARPSFFVMFCIGCGLLEKPLRLHRRPRSRIQRYYRESGQGMIQVQSRHRISQRTLSRAVPPPMWIRIAVVFAALSGLLIARSAPPRLSGGSSGHTAVTHATHDQRPRFDNGGSQWSVPITTFAGTTPPTVRSGVSLATALDPSFHTEGARYNRPPPRG